MHSASNGMQGTYQSWGQGHAPSETPAENLDYQSTGISYLPSAEAGNYGSGYSFQGGGGDDDAEEQEDEEDDDDFDDEDDNGGGEEDDGGKDLDDGDDISMSYNDASVSCNDGTEDTGAYADAVSHGRPEFNAYRGYGDYQAAKSRYRGVCFDKKKKKWRVQIKVCGPIRYVLLLGLPTPHPRPPPSPRISVSTRNFTLSIGL